MSAEYTYYINSEVATDPQELVTSLVITIVNSGDLTGTDLGFYLKVASNTGPFDYPSTDSPATNLMDILAQGNDNEGIVIDQNGNTTTFDSGAGSNYSNRIPLTIGSGTDGDELASGASIEVTLTLSFSVGTPSKNFYIDLVIE